MGDVFADRPFFYGQDIPVEFRGGSKAADPMGIPSVNEHQLARRGGIGSLVVHGIDELTISTKFLKSSSLVLIGKLNQGGSVR